MTETTERIQFKSHEDQIYKAFIKEFREKNVPEQYNQIMLLDEINNPDIDHFMSVSTRTDGKSHNYIHGLIHIAIEYDLGISLFTRNMFLRPSYQTLVDDILTQSKTYDRKDFKWIRQHYYTTLEYKDKTIAVLTDLNSATELKYFSNYLKNFPILVYDEFLALESDYLPDEWEKLKTIYESIDRIDEYPLIKKPKIFYLGNAVNFSSPILSGLKIFNILENHPINSMKFYDYEFKLLLEMRKNENRNTKRNTRAFGSGDDAMSTAQFESNPYFIATENDRVLVKRNPRTIYVKLKDAYLKIFFNRETFTTILSIEKRIEESYQYNLQLKDNKADSIFLNERYFNERHIRKIDKGAYLFDNNYSKNYITNDFHQLNMLKINKLIRESLRNETVTSDTENKEKQYQKNYIEQSKRGLMKKMWG